MYVSFVQLFITLLKGLALCDAVSIIALFVIWAELLCDGVLIGLFLTTMSLYVIYVFNDNGVALVL